MISAGSQNIIVNIDYDTQRKNATPTDAREELKMEMDAETARLS